MSSTAAAVLGDPLVAPLTWRRTNSVQLTFGPVARRQPTVTGSDALLVRLSGLAPDDADRAVLRAQAIESYLPMAVVLARRFGGRGEPLADLVQVAAIGLIKAVDRYDPHRGVPFAGYAMPTILGELKRHFRDRGWTVQVPRRLRELGPRLAVATEELAQILHRSPTTAELATRLAVSHGDVLEARQCASAYRPSSFEQPPFGREQLHLLDVLGGLDPELEAVDRRETLRRRLARLPERQRRVLALRYLADMTQAQIAADIGVSQMQVSRLLAQSLTRLRDGVRTDADSVAPGGPARVVRQVDADRSSRRR
jgi:RNA polymerase sigma-B factor